MKHVSFGLDTWQAVRSNSQALGSSGTWRGGGAPLFSAHFPCLLFHQFLPGAEVKGGEISQNCQPFGASCSFLPRGEC